MKIRIIGDDQERGEVIELLRSKYKLNSVSQEYDSRDDERYKMVYVEILHKSQEIIGCLQDYQVIEYCNRPRSKIEVSRNFKMSFEAAEEILNRLSESGALIKFLNDKKYVFIDEKLVKEVSSKCGNCEHLGPLDRCIIKNDDIRVQWCQEGCEQFKPSLHAIFEMVYRWE